jgi:hypothetical protein
LEKSTDKSEEEQRSATLPKATKSRVSSPMAQTHKPGALIHIQPNSRIESTNGQNNNSKISTNGTKDQISSGKFSGQNNTTATSMSANSDLAVSASSSTSITRTSATPVNSRCVTPVIKQQQNQNRRPTTPALNSALKSTNAFEKTFNKALEVSKNTSSEEKPSMAVPNQTKGVIESDLNRFVPTSTSTPLTSQQISQNSVQKPSESQSLAPITTKSDQNSKSETNSSTLRRGRLTTEDLLIIIHNSKKKHNIKTEPEIIIANSPPSSRSHYSNISSNSPPNLSSGQQSVSSRPNTPSRTPQQPTDRRSWSGTETASPNVTTPGNRRSLASDRLGPTKPTTMNDFKRLLSQTRSNTFTNERLSAAEILRANSKRPLTPVIKCITSFVGSGSKSNTSRVTPSPSPAPTPTPYKQSMRVSPAPSPAPPPQIINGAINANTPNIIKPRIVSGRSFRHPPAYRVDNICQPILEDSAEETDDKKCANIINNQLINTITNNNRYYTQKFINKTPVINNYNKAVANPQSTSTWV